MIDPNTLDDEVILSWFESADLSQCIVTHSMASGILRMRQQLPAQRKRRVDSGVKRPKREDPQQILG